MAQKAGRGDRLPPADRRQPAVEKRLRNAWQDIDQTALLTVQRGPATYYRSMGSTLFGKASSIVQYVAEVKKPDGDRLPGYHEAELESLRFYLLSRPRSTRTSKSRR